MKILRYDEDSDSLYVNLSSKHAYFTAEISPRIGVDLSRNNRVVGVEILDASKVISGVFGEKISRDEIRRLLCRVTQKDAIYLNFELENKRASLAIPSTYPSPVLSLH